jgi:hypothetical protein
MRHTKPMFLRFTVLGVVVAIVSGVLAAGSSPAQARSVPPPSDSPHRYLVSIGEVDRNNHRTTLQSWTMTGTDGTIRPMSSLTRRGGWVASSGSRDFYAEVSLLDGAGNAQWTYRQEKVYSFSNGSIDPNSMADWAYIDYNPYSIANLQEVSWAKYYQWNSYWNVNGHVAESIGKVQTCYPQIGCFFDYPHVKLWGLANGIWYATSYSLG